MKRKPFRNYRDALIEDLRKSPSEAAEYLSVALEEGEPELFLLALRDVAEAYGGMKKLSKKARLNRENLYRMLSAKGNPGIYSLNALLKVFGMKFKVELEKPTPRNIDAKCFGV